MKIVTVRKEHHCVTCGQAIKIEEEALLERFDAVTYAGRLYYCLKCAKVIATELLQEIVTHLK